MGTGRAKDKRKQSIYLPEDMIAEIEAEAERQGRSLSWLIQMAWKITKARIRVMPGVDE